MIDDYPYSGRDLFAEPENYFFAPCDTPEFLDAWRSSRRQAMMALAERAREPGQHGRAELRLPGLELHALLRDLHRDLAGQKVDPLAASEALEPFVVKYEVFKRLFSHYGENGRRLAEAEPAALGSYVLFAACLAYIANAAGSLKHLSTLLKMCDALANQPAQGFTPDEAGMLYEALETEADLVSTRERQIR